MAQTLLHSLEERGVLARAVSIRHLDDLQQSIEDLHQQGLFDEEFYRERLTSYNFAPPEEMPGARSLIAVAYYDPQVRFTFCWEGEERAFVVPPTYLHWQEKDGQAQQTLAGLLQGRGCRVVGAPLPKKLLAVHSGLATYGTNNLTYSAAWGSYHRLAVFYSDLPAEPDAWRELQRMERCEQCRACARSCPTGAISPDRFLLHAERCMTFRNEKPGEVAFPAWIDPSWHHCLVGCMRCQKVCPENKGKLGADVEGAAFSAEETALLLEGVPLAQLPAALAEKLRRWDLVDLLDVLRRNLRLLLQRDGQQE